MLIHVVGDIGRAGASLSVTCLNCGHKAYVKARLLVARYGYGWPLERLQSRFRCSSCKGQNVRLGLALPELATPKLQRMQWFGSLYENLDD
jgi:DNA-directed RNA polymerase subunit RPC12/RpoP